MRLVSSTMAHVGPLRLHSLDYLLRTSCKIRNCFTILLFPKPLSSLPCENLLKVRSQLKGCVRVRVCVCLCTASLSSESFLRYKVSTLKTSFNYILRDLRGYTYYDKLKGV
jgi:hypothetical protein